MLERTMSKNESNHKNTRQKSDTQNNKQLLSTPYDRYFKASIAIPEIAIPFVKTHVSPALSNKIDYSTFKVVQQSFITDELKEYASDVILEFDLISPDKGNLKPKSKLKPKIKVAILIEHQSTPDKFMAFRVIHYMLCYLQQQFKQQGKNKKLLTPVYPLIFYNGKQTPYPYSLKFEDAFDDPYQIMSNVLAKAIPLIDVNELEEKRLRTQKLLGVMTRALKVRNIVDSLNYLKTIMIDLNSELIISGDQNNYGQIVMTFLANVREPDELQKAIEENPELTVTLKGEYMTAAEYFTQKGEAKKSRAMAINAIEKGLDTVLIADLTELDIKTIEQIKSELENP